MTLEDSVDARPGPGRWVRGAGAGRAGGLRAAAAAAAGRRGWCGVVRA